MIKEIHTIKLNKDVNGYGQVSIHEDDGEVVIDFGEPSTPGSGQTIWLECACGTEGAIDWLKANLRNISYRWD